jgi:hypothetical protein
MHAPGPSSPGPSSPRPDAAAPAPDAQPRPWWRWGMVWLVLSGPAAVVVAGVATTVIAVRGADTPIAQGQGSHTPALAARAAQPQKPAP